MFCQSRQNQDHASQPKKFEHPLSLQVKTKSSNGRPEPVSRYFRRPVAPSFLRNKSTLTFCEMQHWNVTISPLSQHLRRQAIPGQIKQIKIEEQMILRFWHFLGAPRQKTEAKSRNRDAQHFAPFKMHVGISNSEIMIFGRRLPKDWNEL